MSKLSEIKVAVSPLTNNIFAGYVKDDRWTSKVDVTDQVIKAVMEHLSIAQCDYQGKLGVLTLKPSVRE